MTLNARVAKASQKGVGASSLVDAVEHDADLLKSNPDAHMRMQAIDSLVQSRDARAVIPILGVLPELPADDEKRVKQQLVAFGETAVLPLLGALQSGDDRMRLYAAELLGDLGDTRAVRPLAKALSDENRLVRHAAALALDQFQHTPILPELIEMFQDDDAMVRLVVITMLARRLFWGDERAIAALIDAHNDPSDPVRWVVIQAFCRHREARTLPFVLEAMLDEHVLNRFSAMTALAEMREPQAIPLLMRALTAVSSLEREDAGKALLKFGDKDALAIALLTDPQMSVATKLDTMTALIKIRFRVNDIRLDYRSRSVPQYCQELLEKEITPETREAIHTVIAEITARLDKTILLRASGSSTDGADLLRAADETKIACRPDEMARASDGMEGGSESRAPWLMRLLKRRR